MPPKRKSLKQPLQPQFESLSISKTIDDIDNDENVISYSVKVNKKTGYFRCDMRNSDGRTITKTFLGPGLEEAMRYDPAKASTDEHDSNIKSLLNKGLTQTDVAARLGVSQALVSKVHRS